MTKATKETLRRVASKFVISSDPKQSFIAGYMVGVMEQAAKRKEAAEQEVHKKSA